jgi:hypothetical protein
MVKRAMLFVCAAALLPAALATAPDAALAKSPNQAALERYSPQPAPAARLAPGRATEVGEAAEHCDCLDLVLVIDDTGSMAGAIGNVQAGMFDILALADTLCTDVRAGLITFKDDVEVDLGLTGNLTDVANAVSALTAVGGNLEPEASDEALREALTSTVCMLTGDFDSGAWRDTCCKVAILVTDARPGGCDDAYTDGVDDVNAHARALDALAADIAIGALYVPTFADYTPEILAVMTDYAATSGGLFGQTAADGSGTAAAIEQIILDCAAGADTELCCLPDGRCLEVLAGSCEAIGGHVVADCFDCRPVPAEGETWGKIKSSFRAR